MDDINKNNNSEINSLPTEATPKNTELDIFVNLLRQADISNAKNEKEDRLNAIRCYEKALFGDGINFKGIFIESIFMTLTDAIGNYVKHYFDFSIVEEFLEKINNAVVERGIIEDGSLHIFRLTKVFDIAISNQLTDKIVDLVEKVKFIYHLENLESQEAFCKRLSDEISVNQSDDNLNENKMSQIVRGKLLMRIVNFDNIQEFKKTKPNESKIDILKKVHDKLVDLAYQEGKDKKEAKDKFNKTEVGIKQPALPFINIISSWIESDKSINENYRKAMPRLYYAIEFVFGSKYDKKNAEKYDAKSFLLKTILKVQLKRIHVRVCENEMDKAWEYFVTLIENLKGRTPYEKELGRLVVKYADNESMSILKNEIQDIYANVFFTGHDAKTRSEQRGAFLKIINEFCNETLYLIKDKDNNLYEGLKDIFKLFAETTYEKIYSNGEIKEIIGSDTYFQAYNCAEILYETGGDHRKIRRCLEFAKQLTMSNVHSSKKNDIQESIINLEIKLEKVEKSNLVEVMELNGFTDIDELIGLISDDKEFKGKLNRQAYYNILYILFSKSDLRDEAKKRIKNKLSNSWFSLWIIDNILTHTKQISDYRYEIIQYILDYAVLLEREATKESYYEILKKQNYEEPITDNELTQFTISLMHFVILKTTNEINDNDIQTLIEKIVTCYNTTFSEENLSILPIIKLLTKIAIAKNSENIMSYLLERMVGWRRNSLVDEEFFKLLIHYLKLINQDSPTKTKTESTSSKLKEKFSVTYNSRLTRSLYSLIKNNKELKINIDDYIYNELNVFIDINSKGLENATKKYYNKNISFNQFRTNKHVKRDCQNKKNCINDKINIVNFQLELGKLPDAKKSFESVINNKYYQEIESEVSEQVKVISAKIEEADARANQGLSRFSGAKTLDDDWRRHYSSKEINEKRRIIKEKIEAHDTKPMRDIIYLLRDHPYVKRFIHDLGSDKKAKTPVDLIRICKPILETNHLMLNESLPFDFGKTLYDYYSSEKWNCWESSNNTFVQRPSLNQCESFECKEYREIYQKFNSLLKIRSTLRIFKDMPYKDAPLTLELRGRNEIDAKGDGFKSGYRAYLPSIQRAIDCMVSETKDSTETGKSATLIPRVRTAKYFNNNCAANENHLFVEFITIVR